MKLDNASLARAQAFPQARRLRAQLSAGPKTRRARRTKCDRARRGLTACPRLRRGAGR